MLNSHPTSSLRASSTLVLAALLALGSAGCASSLSGEQDTTIHFLVEPDPGTQDFTGWTEITVDGNINSVGVANLYGVTLGLQEPSTVSDLSFLSTLVGKASTPSGLTQVTHLDAFPRGEPSVSMHIDYLGDLHPLFETSSTIRIDWSGTVNPDFTAWPAAGIWVQGDVIINIQ